MTKTLILAFHPNLMKSTANRALLDAIRPVKGIEIVDMRLEYPNGMDLSRDGEREAARLLEADRIVLQFPVQWYSTPPLMKAWQDAVLTRMFYLAYDTEGRKINGMPVMVVATAGNTADAYRPGGRNMFAMIDLLAPLRATAHRCGLRWSEPFIVYEANKIAPEALAATAADFRSVIESWVSTNTNFRKAA
jgi:glutathione-regulated potassium-efflux system ancillary protein KefG